MTGRFIGKTVVEHQNEFVEDFPYGKQVGNCLDIENCQKRAQAPRPIFLGLESEKSENQVSNLEIFEKYIKDAPNKTVQIGSYAFPNELVRFRIEATTIWGEIQKHCKNAVII